MKTAWGKIDFGTIALILAGILFLAAIVTSIEKNSGTSGVDARLIVQQQDAPTVDVTFTSDPEGAVLYVNGQQIALTPTTVQLPEGQPTAYRIVPIEPYEDYDLYKPYSGTITPTGEESVSVWLERTTAEEQATQRERAEDERTQARQRQIEANVRNSRWRYVERRDPITDDDTSLISTPATAYPSILQDDARLYIRCGTTQTTSRVDAHGIAIVIAADDYLGNDSVRADYRFDNNAPFTGQSWIPSTDGDAVFVPSSQVPSFVQRLAGSDSLIVRLYDYRGTSLDYEFDVSAGGDALRLLGCYRGHIPE